MSRMDISAKLWQKSDTKYIIKMIKMSVIFGHPNKHLSDKNNKWSKLVYVGQTPSIADSVFSMLSLVHN